MMQKNKKTCSLVFLFFLFVFAAAADEPKLAWQQALGGNLLCTPLYQIGSLAAICDGGKLVSFSLDGDLQWQYKAGGKLLPFFARSGNGTTYIFRTNNMLLAVNRTGRLLWQRNLHAAVTGNPIIGFDGRIFIFLAKKIICLNAQGNNLWELDLESPLAYDAVPDKNGGFAAVLTDGTFISVDAFSSLSARLLPAIPKIIVPLSSKNTLLIYSGGKIDMLENNKLPVPLTPLKADAVAASEYKNDAAILLATGEIVFLSVNSVRTAGLGININQNELYKIDFNLGEIIILSLNAASAFNEELKPLWKINFDDLGTVLPAFGNNFVFAGGKNWVLNAYKTGVPASYNAGDVTVKPKGMYGLGRPPNSDMGGGVYGGKAEFERHLKTISSLIRKGTLGKDEIFYTKFLMGIALAKNQFAESANPENFRLRIEAILLLGKTGSSETIPFLVDLFTASPDLNIKAAVSEALGVIGQDPEGRVLSAFSALVMSNTQPHNERLLCAIIKSISRICIFSGPTVSEAGIPLITLIKKESRSKLVKETAEKELNLLFTD
ncbi:MAG: PQQ-binding-like beta-propeller repeat protein [Spirochaetaceae bacterium]|jgi:hypothetical protein|nr:PQQ-binding-like beta-propeller repeat protein [Spirochaetaceae bacterium]